MIEKGARNLLQDSPWAIAESVPSLIVVPVSSCLMESCSHGYHILLQACTHLGLARTLAYNQYLGHYNVYRASLVHMYRDISIGSPGLMFRDENNATEKSKEVLQNERVGMPSSPIVSIVMPTKNSANTLEHTLESVNNQTYRYYEIIIVDNHSTDDTLVIAKKYTNKIYIVGPERSAQLNFGIENAQGKYIYRIDSDWILEPTVLEQAVKKCEHEKFDAILIHNTDDPTVSFWGRVRNFERDMYQEDDLNVATRFIRKDVLDKVGYFDEKIIAAEDYDLHNRIVAAGYRVGRIRAKEIHVGVPRTLMELIKKHYYYGTTLPEFLAKNPKKGMRQLSPLRPAYAKHWKLFFRHPVIAVGFMIYQAVRYSSAILGYVTVVALSRSKHHM